MFAIVISEKGGAERRELFDKHEINVGRVQGNDLMLPKGNVSKRHARLLYRDGRFIVTDLKSTNGTYVNGRKIAQATIVREGDKIYVGDFVLRVEMSAATPSSAPKRASGASTGPSPTMGIAPPPPRPSAPSFDSEFTARHDAIIGAGLLDSNEGTGRHTPRDVSEMASPPAARMPMPSSEGSSEAPSAPPARSASPPVPVLVPRSPNLPSSPALRARRAPTSRAIALSSLVERVTEAIDLAPLARGAEPDQVLAHRIERIVREKAKMLRDEGQLPEAVDVDETIRDAQRELFGLGAIEGAIEDEDVTEIRAFGHQNLTAVRAGDVFEIDPPFSSEGALHRAIVRLCRQSAAPLAPGETVIERYTSRGLLIQAVLPPTSQSGPALIVKKRRRAEVGLDDLVRSGTVSRAMATFLHGCLSARANLLLVGPPDGTALLLSAFAAAGQVSDR